MVLGIFQIVREETIRHIKVRTVVFVVLAPFSNKHNMLTIEIVLYHEFPVVFLQQFYSIAKITYGFVLAFYLIDIVIRISVMNFKARFLLLDGKL